MTAASYLSLVLISQFAFDAAHADDRPKSIDIAESYFIDSRGGENVLVRTLKSNGKECDVTNNVSNFKIASDKDSAMIYFRKEDGRLLRLNNSRSNGGNCPKANDEVPVPNVKKYDLIPGKNTPIAAVMLSKIGGRNFKGNGVNIGRLSVVGSERTHGETSTFDYLEGDNYTDFVDYRINPNYDRKNAGFNGYFLFAIKKNGIVFKLHGKNYSKSKFDGSRFYNDLDDFMDHNDIGN